LHAELAVRPCTDDDRTRLREMLGATRRQEGLMIALGVTGGALVTAGTALLIRGGSSVDGPDSGSICGTIRVGLTIAGAF
jgi:hypothetical protein